MEKISRLEMNRNEKTVELALFMEGMVKSIAQSDGRRAKDSSGEKIPG